TRTWQRWMGTPFKKVKSRAGSAEYILSEVPTDEEQELASTAFREIAKEVTASTRKAFSAMDVQAVLWFYEKDLYKALGVRVDRGTFSEGARAYAANPVHLGKKAPAPSPQRELFGAASSVPNGPK